MYDGKIVVVTGAARGLGRALAFAYAEAGAKVIGVDVLESDFNNEDIDFVIQDLSDAAGVDQLFDRIKKAYGTVHILINNGAIAFFNKSIFEITNEEFHKVIGVNLEGSFACCRAFVRVNQGEAYGRIINIASTRFNQNEANWDAYGASKGGLVSLTSSLAVSLSHTPITVNAISPGWIQTEDYDSLREADHIQHPSGRVGRTDDVVRAAMFLTDEQNDFVNGHNLVVDGGMTKKMIYEE